MIHEAPINCQKGGPATLEAVKTRGTSELLIKWPYFTILPGLNELNKEGEYMGHVIFITNTCKISRIMMINGLLSGF